MNSDHLISDEVSGESLSGKEAIARDMKVSSLESPEHVLHCGSWKFGAIE